MFGWFRIPGYQTFYFRKRGDKRRHSTLYHGKLYKWPFFRTLGLPDFLYIWFLTILFASKIWHRNRTILETLGHISNGILFIPFYLNTPWENWAPKCSSWVCPWQRAFLFPCSRGDCEKGQEVPALFSGGALQCKSGFSHGCQLTREFHGSSL